MNESKTLTANAVTQLRKRLEEGVAMGALAKPSPPQYAIWRFQDLRSRAFLTCFGQRNGQHKLLLQGDERLVMAALNGDWEALLPVIAVEVKEADAGGPFVGPRATLEFLSRPCAQDAAEAHSRPQV